MYMTFPIISGILGYCIFDYYIRFLNLLVVILNVTCNYHSVFLSNGHAIAIYVEHGLQ